MEGELWKVIYRMVKELEAQAATRQVHGRPDSADVPVERAARSASQVGLRSEELAEACVALDASVGVDDQPTHENTIGAADAR